MPPQTNMDALFEDLGLTLLSDEQKQEFLAKIGDVLNQEISNALLMRLSNEQLSELEKLLEHEPDSQKQSDITVNFVRTHIPNVEEVIVKTTENFYEKLKTANGIFSQPSDNTTPTPETPIL